MALTCQTAYSRMNFRSPCSTVFIVIYIMTVVPLCQSWIFPDDDYINGRWRRQSCQSNQFHCKSGECISSFLRCDGQANCQDKSDETSEACMKIVCPSYAFRCKYGGCADADSKCNGKEDCVDGSDETGCPMQQSQNNVTCRPRQFRCDSGICIDPFLLCDGNVDCDDGSDETAKECGKFSCQQYVFRCDYGACIDRDGVCNGIKQCADGSDENPSLCGTTTTSTTTPSPPPATECLLPEQPQNGEYELGGCVPPRCTVPAPGTPIQIGLLTYKCKPGFQLSGSPVVFCNGGWQSPLPSCEKASCPPILDRSREYKCKLNEKDVECNRPMPPGTEVKAPCSTFYTTIPEFRILDIRCLENGTWNQQILPCTPGCGHPNPQGLPFVSHGVEAKLGEFPWHVGIYKMNPNGNLQQWCSGSLISPRAIVTAAHCFWNIPAREIYNIKEFRIAVGKYYREWERKTTYEQVLEINSVKLHENFRGADRHYQDDIAVVVLQTELNISLAVQPICIDYISQYTDHLTTGKAGTVMGWGLTEDNVKSDVLKTATLPFVSFPDCEKSVPESFVRYLSSDKFCAGYNNGTSVCQGDSGGGYATKFRDGRWYLMGIVSIGVPSANPSECNKYQYTTFTKVFNYYDFIKTSAG